MNTLTICLIGGTHIRALSDSQVEDPDLLRGETPNGKRFAVPARNILIMVEDENADTDSCQCTDGVCNVL